MESPVKKINKWLIWIIIWWTLLWLTSLQKWEKSKWIIGRSIAAFVWLWRSLLDRAERRWSALWWVKPNENTSEKVKHEEDVQ
jgi:hypothetical protein